MLVDPSGLTQAQIDATFKFVKENLQGLDFGDKFIVENIPGAFGAYDAFGDKLIRVDDWFLKDLDEREMGILLDTFIHEGLHKNDSSLDTIRISLTELFGLKSSLHEDIFKLAEAIAEKLKEKFKKDVIDRGCN